MQNFKRSVCAGFAALLMLSAAGVAGTTDTAGTAATTTTAQSVRSAQPWMNTALTPDKRADLVLAQMTLDEKIGMLHGIMPVRIPRLMKKRPIPAEAIGSSGYVPGVPRLGIPALQESDASYGVTNLDNVRPGDKATALPSGEIMASSFDPSIVYAGGAVVGREARAKGLNVMLAGGVDVVRDPRNGRNFEYLGEDPLLAGTLAGAQIRGIQDQHVISTIKHFAVNAQETDRKRSDSIISEKAMRESDLLTFEIAIEKGHPGAVMCGYNLVNGAYACGNKHLLTDVLKTDWKYPGWAISDWGAVHSTSYATAGLDQESAAELDADTYFGAPLKAAVKAGKIPEARVDDMVHRILRSMFAAGVIDHPAKKAKIDYAAGKKVALKAAEAGIVLLRNKGVLPLVAHAQKIAVIGGMADHGVLSGGGSSNVVPPGSLVHPLGHNALQNLLARKVWHPSAPLAAIKAAAPKATVKFDDGHYLSTAVKLAKWADVVIVFGTKWDREAADNPDLTLPDGQDALIDAVAAAGKKTIVVLETGNPVLMPWLKKTDAVVEAWYSGEAGGEAIANVLFGKVNPAGHLPITFPASPAQLPRPEIPHYGRNTSRYAPYTMAHTFKMPYPEGALVGYRWYAAKHETPLFPFGYGLSYTSFRYGHLVVAGGKSISASFDVTNTGKRDGATVPQLYLTDAAGKKEVRLLGFQKVSLKPGETRRVSLITDRRLLADYDVKAHGWKIKAGTYRVKLAADATDPGTSATAKVRAGTLAP